MSTHYIRATTRRPFLLAILRFHCRFQCWYWSPNCPFSVSFVFTSIVVSLSMSLSFNCHFPLSSFLWGSFLNTFSDICLCFSEIDCRNKKQTKVKTPTTKGRNHANLKTWLADGKRQSKRKTSWWTWTRKIIGAP